MMIRTACLAVTAMICLAAEAQIQEERTREYPEYHCKVTLPEASFQWLDHSAVKGAAMIMGNAAQAKLLLVARKAPAGIAVTDKFCKGIDDGFFEPEAVSKISGEVITFRGVPCYEVRARLGYDSSVAVLRSFAANGHVYQLQLLGAPVADLDKQQVEKLFASFELIGTPVLSSPEESDAVPYAGTSRTMGKIAAYCFIAIGLLAVVKKFSRKK
ncbi:MAG: hypothetical protein HN380_04730 [Victivallales bacterium]|nr:hypothetical protein [Victivallales bacterium]